MLLHVQNKQNKKLCENQVSVLEYQGPYIFEKIDLQSPYSTGAAQWMPTVGQSLIL